MFRVLCILWLGGFFETESLCSPGGTNLRPISLSFLSVQITSVYHTLVELLDHRYFHILVQLKYKDVYKIKYKDDIQFLILFLWSYYIKITTDKALSSSTKVTSAALALPLLGYHICSPLLLNFEVNSKVTTT